MDNIDESEETTIPLSRVIKTSTNPLVRNKGYGSPISKNKQSPSPKEQDVQQTLPTVRLGNEFIIDASAYKNSSSYPS